MEIIKEKKKGMFFLGAGSGLLSRQKAVSVSHFVGLVAQPVSFPRGTSGVPAVLEGNCVSGASRILSCVVTGAPSLCH